MNLKRWHWVGGLALTGLTACTVGPDYHAPHTDIGQGWSQPASTATPAAQSWWQSLHDAELNRLVVLALQHNPDLQASRARIVQARAARDAAMGLLLPQAGIAASVNALRQSENGPLPLRQIPFIPRDETIRDVEFDASWDTDLFGANRRTIEAARAQHQAAIASAQDVRMSLVAELVRNYLMLRGEQREWQARQQVVSLLQDNVDTVKRRVTARDVPQSALDQAVMQCDAAAAQLPAMRASLRALALSIGILTGRPPESGLYLLDSPGVFPRLAGIPVGERADVLRRRPDVRVAERQLAAATAEIGVAKAQWFPQLVISAGAGFQSIEPGNWLTMPSQTGTIMPLVSWQIFDGGRIEAQVHAAQARERSAAQAYVSVVLAALDDAERALSDYRHALDTLQREQDALDAAQRADAHAQAAFAAGEIDRQDRLTSQLALTDARIAMLVARTQAASSWVALNKALGLPV